MEGRNNQWITNQRWTATPKQGSITLSQLDLLDIPYEIINKDSQKIDELISKGVRSAKSRKGPFAIIVRKNSFENIKCLKI